MLCDGTLFSALVSVCELIGCAVSQPALCRHNLPLALFEFSSAVFQIQPPSFSFQMYFHNPIQRCTALPRAGVFFVYSVA